MSNPIRISLVIGKQASLIDVAERGSETSFTAENMEKGITKGIIGPEGISKDQKHSFARNQIKAR